jgi:hypothetical protein
LGLFRLSVSCFLAREDGNRDIGASLICRRKEPEKSDAPPRNKKLIAVERWLGWFVRDQCVLIPSTGRRPIVIKTAAEPHGVEAL